MSYANDKWIPVSWENLPEDESKVLCCTITKKGNKNIVIGYYSRELESWVCGMNSNVIAWMPLPEPPRFDRVIDVFEKPDERVAVEGYRLTLTHFMDCRDGERNIIEDPITVQAFYDRSSQMPASYCVNEMLERLKHEILHRI